MFRHQLAVYSPLDLHAVQTGIGALTRVGAETALRSVATTLAERFGSPGVLLTDSGTSALALALRHSAAPAVRPVALPAYACYDLATATDATKVPFLFYDIDPATLGPDFDSLRRALEAGADRIVIVHLFGVPVDLTRAAALASEFGALIIEDAAQAVGATIRGRPAGAFGSLGVLSFNRGKGVTAGRGGALLANDEAGVRTLEAARPGLQARSGGTFRDVVALLGQWALARPSLYRLPASLPFLGLGETIYRAPHPPTTPTSFALGVLVSTLTLADQESEKRRQNSARLSRALPVSCTPIGPSVPGSVSGCLRLPFIASADWIHRLESPAAKRLGIARGYPLALVDLPGFANRAHPTAGDWRGGRLLAARLFTLPTHSALRERDLEALQRWLSRQPTPSVR